MCITCGAPHSKAPDLMAWETDAQCFPLHCYFKKQPETQEELSRAIAAVVMSCCGGLVYAGQDADIIKRLQQAGASDAVITKG